MAKAGWGCFGVVQETRFLQESLKGKWARLEQGNKCPYRTVTGIELGKGSAAE